MRLRAASPEAKPTKEEIMKSRILTCIIATNATLRTPDSQKMFAATTKGSFLLEDPAKTCDVMEEAINLAFEGRPGPVHIHVPENLTHHGITVDNYRDIQLDVKPVLPDTAQIVAAEQGSRRPLLPRKSLARCSE
jgi:thiamine pyrophosphate-dependent acetolactate synthase large subunit-like protein